MQQPEGRAGYPAFAGSVSSRGVPTIFSFWNVAGPFSPLVRLAGDTGQARGKRGSRLYKTQMGVVFVLGGLTCHLPGRRPERENVSGATVTLCVLFLYRRDPGGTRPYLWVGEPELVLSELESLKNVPLCLFYGDLRKISDEIAEDEKFRMSRPKQILKRPATLSDAYLTRSCGPKAGRTRARRQPRIAARGGAPYKP
jgi:hypothetical protein